MTLAERIAARKPEPPKEPEPEWIRRMRDGHLRAKELAS